MGEPGSPLPQRSVAGSRAEAVVMAEQWLARRTELQGKWFDWVAAQLYVMSPPAFAAAVRRELQRLTSG
ncbi:hypothetical protein SJI00_03990 [Pseudomonas sp. RP23018S]|uniref:hypothetical protein n=1 Tax=Pseudomonas sp. RP23018S TaxID=3096037 RepID=UPI002ACA567A|nr:hypothetical protein [Pseudomonas sp. RP23018S]MDZ5601940.1 hypothetical protein [Pseudomonas sp. RP23018S]